MRFKGPARNALKAVLVQFNHKIYLISMFTAAQGAVQAGLLAIDLDPVSLV